MPDRCCVTACHSNYDKSGVYVSVFKFPKSEDERQIWLQNIHRKGFVPTKRSVVCEKHFQPDCIIWYDELPKDGEVFKIKRCRPMLKPGSIPTLFPVCQALFSEAPSASKRKSKLQHCERLQVALDPVICSLVQNNVHEDIHEAESKDEHLLSPNIKEEPLLEEDSQGVNGLSFSDSSNEFSRSSSNGNLEIIIKKEAEDES